MYKNVLVNSSGGGIESNSKKDDGKASASVNVGKKRSIPVDGNPKKKRPTLSVKPPTLPEGRRLCSSTTRPTVEKATPLADQNSDSDVDSLISIGSDRTPSPSKDPNPNTSATIVGKQRIGISETTRRATISSKAPLTMGTNSTSESTNDIGPCGDMTGAELNDILSSGKELTVLLVDVRPAAKFQECRVKFSVNFPLVINGSSVTGSFPTKASVATFLQENYKSMFGFLNAPGFYAEIVVFDSGLGAKPNAHNQSFKVLLDAIDKWNANSRTKTRTLHGGFIKFANQYPDGVTSKSYRSGAWTISRTIFKRVQYPSCSPSSTPSSTTMSREAKHNIDMLNDHHRDLNSFDNNIASLLKSKRKLKSLTAVKLELEKEEKMEMDQVLETLIPSVAKCGVCLKIFTGNIYQCINGHCVCEGCIINRVKCSTCQVDMEYVSMGKIRNPALETLMKTKLTAQCPYNRNGCNLTLTYGELPGHVETCGKKTNEHVLTIQKEIEKAKEEIVVRNEKLFDLSKKIEDTQFRINAMMEDDVTEVPEELMESIFTSHINIIKGKMAVTLETFITRNEK